MNNKTLLLIGGGLLLVVAGFFVLNNYIYQEKQSELVEGQTVERQGSVLAVDLEGVAADGPALITLESDNGELSTIAVPSMGLPLCEAADNIADVYALQAGDKISVNGTVSGEGYIVPCESPDHYLRVDNGGLQRHVDQETGLSFRYREQPNGYVLQQPSGPQEHADFVKMFVLMLKADQEELEQRQNGEGPPTINVMVFENPKNQQPRAWADENANISNMQLLRGEVAETTLAGANAIRYQTDGLYLADNVVVANGGYMYIISGSYLEEGSQIHRDFQPFLDSIQFIPESSSLENGEHLGFIHAAGIGNFGYIEFDDATWLSGKEGEDAAIAAGQCTEATRSECLPNDYYIQNDSRLDETIPLDQAAQVVMQTWNAEDAGVAETEISLAEFAEAINNDSLHWNDLPYRVTTENGVAVRIEEVYVP